MPKAKQVKTRRGNNEGSIYQREDGIWIGAVSLGYDNTGKRIRKSFSGRTRSEVAMKMSEALSQAYLTNKLNIQSEPLQVIMSEWLHTYKQAQVSGRTFEKCLDTVRVHIYPELGDRALTDINTNIIQTLLNRKIVKGYALATVRKIKFLLNQFFAYCKRNNFVTENPVTDCIVKSTAEHKEQREDRYKAIPPDVRQKVFDAVMSDKTLGPICLLQLLCGMRIGEVLALKWNDIDYENHLIKIDNAITQIPQFDKDYNVVSRKTVISDTKTNASMREVPMPALVEEVLQTYFKERWTLSVGKAVSLVDKNDIVFSNPTGGVRSYGGIRTCFRRLMKRKGLEEYKIHFHMLRHTFSAMLFEEQENPRIIQMLLGHKSISTTLTVYNSVDRSFFKETTDKLQNKFAAK